jgi:hypothetical protein
MELISIDPNQLGNDESISRDEVSNTAVGLQIVEETFWLLLRFPGAFRSINCCCWSIFYCSATFKLLSWL